jgi:hypothetical protein
MKGDNQMNEDSKNPGTGGKINPIVGGGTSNVDWWPNQLSSQPAVQGALWYSRCPGGIFPAID